MKASGMGEDAFAFQYYRFTVQIKAVCTFHSRFRARDWQSACDNVRSLGGVDPSVAVKCINNNGNASERPTGRRKLKIESTEEEKWLCSSVEEGSANEPARRGMAWHPKASRCNKYVTRKYNKKKRY